jgi:hypothetical protein
MKRLWFPLQFLVLCQLFMSCDGNWPYKPSRFIPPVPAPPKQGFISRDSLAQFCGSSNVTMVYNLTIQGVMTQTIYFVHFADANAAPARLKKPSNRESWQAESPNLSPDGKLVTYYMYSGSQCAAYTQRLDTAAVPVLVADPGSDPHFYSDGQGKLFVTYSDTTGALVGLLSAINTRATFKQQVDEVTGTLIGSPIKIAKVPLYGGLSKDGKYLCSGYFFAYIYGVDNDSLYQINPGLQTCNPSISPDALHPDRMMFLNFQGPQNINNDPYGAKPIGAHKAIFIVDKTNTAISYYDVNEILGPAKDEWQDPRWSNNPGFFSALASENEEWDIYLVNSSTKKTLRLNIPSQLRVNSTSTPYVFIPGGA